MKWLIFLCMQIVATSALAAPHNPLSADTAARSGNPVGPGSNGIPTCPVSSGTGSITTSTAAVTSARAAWQALYDKDRNTDFSRESMARFEPYTATLKDGRWRVRGTVPPGFHGSVVESTVCASDGRVAVTLVAIQ